MNYFCLPIALLYAGAAVREAMRGCWTLAGVYVCYACAAALLALVRDANRS